MDIPFIPSRDQFVPEAIKDLGDLLKEDLLLSDLAGKLSLVLSERVFNLYNLFLESSDIVFKIIDIVVRPRNIRPTLFVGFAQVAKILFRLILGILDSELTESRVLFSR